MLLSFSGCRARKYFSISSRLLPLVSGTCVFTKIKAIQRAKTKNRNAPPKPTVLSRTGKAEPTQKSTIHRKKIHIPMPKPRSCKGKISAIISQSTGPIQPYIKARKNIVIDRTIKGRNGLPARKVAELAITARANIVPQIPAKNMVRRPILPKR